MEAQTNEIKNKLLLNELKESGQFKLAIDTQAKAVILPIPCEIIKAGGTRIDSELMVETKVIFIVCTAKSNVIIKIICLDVVVGFSFFETNIRIQQLIKTSKKVKSHEIISDEFRGEESRY